MVRVAFELFFDPTTHAGGPEKKAVCTRQKRAKAKL